MKKIQIQNVVILGCGLFWSFSSFAIDEKGLSLENAFQLSLKRSEDLIIQEEQVIQAEEKVTQAKGGFLPSINGVGTFLKQDTSAVFVTSPSTQNTIKINVDQPLFKGFRDFAALKQQKTNLISSEYLRDQAKTQLFMDVSQAYYQLIILFHDFAIYQHQVELNQKRLSELRAYRKIGRSREADVLALQASIASLEASIEAVRSQTESGWSVFSFLTGLNHHPVLADDESAPEKLSELSTYLEKVKNRPDIKALESSVWASEEGIRYAKAGHLPTLDLIGNYYFDRPGVLSPVKWDAQLALNFPIFQGGLIQSQVRQASSQHQQAELQYEKAKRQALQQVELYYQQLKIEYSQEEKQSKASDLAQKNYEAQLKDSRLGLTTNIDVLTALSGVQDSLRLTNRIHYQAKMDYLKLLAATAERPLK